MIEFIVGVLLGAFLGTLFSFVWGNKVKKSLEEVHDHLDKFAAVISGGVESVRKEVAEKIAPKGALKINGKVLEDIIKKEVNK